MFVSPEGLMLIKASESTSSSAQKIAGHRGQQDSETAKGDKADWQKKEPWQGQPWKKARKWNDEDHLVSQLLIIVLCMLSVC